MRSSVSIVALVVLLGLIGWHASKVFEDPTVFPPDDYVEYWAAGKLNAEGFNPYDPELLLPLEKGPGNRTNIDFAVMMWNPPWTLSLAMPIGLLPSRTGQFLWLFVNFLLIGGCAVALWHFYGGTTKHIPIGVLLALLFMPSVYLFRAGQITGWLLLGATLFLYFERGKRDYLAGAAAALFGIKPHLVYLFFAALFVWSFYNSRGWKMIAGGLAAGAIASIPPLLCNPCVFHQFVEALTHRPPDYEMPPTIGSLLRHIEGLEDFAISFVPLALGLGWLVLSCHSRRREPFDWPERLPAILLASFATAAYGAWPFDMVLLLPAVLHIAARIDAAPKTKYVRAGIVGYLLFELPQVVLSAFSITSFYWFWAAPALWLIYVVLDRIISTGRKPQ